MHNWTLKNGHEKLEFQKSGPFSFGIGWQYTNTVVA